LTIKLISAESGPIGFAAPIFSGKANFRNANFKDNASVEDTTFAGTACLDGASPFACCGQVPVRFIL
jgi:hypothetical protein